MLRSCLMALSVSLAGLTAVASPANAATAPSASAEVARAMEAFRSAMVRADTKTIMQLASPKLTFGHSNGKVQSRAEFAKTVASREEDFKTIRLYNRRQTIVGDTAIVRYVFDANILIKGKMQHFLLDSVQVWHKDNGSWKMVARQAFKPNK